MQYESRPVHPTETISEGWELIKNDYWLFFGMTLVMMLIVIAVSSVLGGVVGLIAQAVARGVGAAAGNVAGTAAALLPQIIEQVFSIFTNLAAGVLSAMFMCGIYIALSRKASGGAADFGDLFAGFRYFLPCLLVALIYTVIQFFVGITTILIAFAFGISSFGAEILAPGGRIEPQIFQRLIPVFLVIGLFYLIFLLIFAVLTSFVYQLIAVRNFSAMEAIMQSVRAGLKNFFGLVGLFIIQFFIALGGALLCGVGILFVLPILVAANFADYLRVFGRTTDLGAQHSPPPPPIFGNEADSRFSQF
ncbi:MAG TPA: hypothetical protein VEQ34_03620 [Pyrinomonadaceae bacterium]|nr:hypothetical protein [Pyrinomonadaceae bacterium]